MISNMDKKKAKALEFLRKCLGEIDYLRSLRYDSQDWKLWKDKVHLVVEEGFGKGSKEVANLPYPVTIILVGASDAKHQEQYLSELKWYEPKLREILQKYRILKKLQEPEASDEEKALPKEKPPLGFQLPHRERDI